MKVLQINKLYYPHVGGVESIVRHIAEGLNGSDNLVLETLVCQSQGKRVVENIDGVKVWRAGSWGRIFSLPISLDFFRLFFKLAPDYDAIIFHEPFPLGTLAQFFYKPRPNQKVLVYYHSDIIRQKIFKWFFYPFLKNNLRRADKVLVGSHNLITHSPVLKPVAANCQVIYFGINPVEFALTPEIESAVAELKNKYGRFTLAVGRLVYYKGYEYLIAALAELKKRGSAARLIIIGQGSLKEKLVAQVQNLNLENQVIILDKVSDLCPYYYASDFLILPSCANSEAFALVQIEAMACGRPVINTNLPTGVPEVSLDSQTGLTVPIKNAPALAAAIDKLWTDDELRAHYGQVALNRVQENFTRAKFLADLKKIISSNK